MKFQKFDLKSLPEPFPLEFLLSSGGPLAGRVAAMTRLNISLEWLEATLEGQHPAFFDSLCAELMKHKNCELEINARTPREKAELRLQNLKKKRSELFSDKKTSFVGFDKSRQDQWLERWAGAIFPGLTGHAKWSLNFARLLATYRPQMPEIEIAPWEALRFFAGTLRSQQVEMAEVAALDYAAFSALFSPQDELKERQSLAPGELMMNPSAQVVPLAKQGLVKALVREAGPPWRLKCQDLSYRDAHVVDELRENFRLPGASFNGEMTAVVNELTELGLVLRGMNHLQSV